ncbi:hypothetical protein D3C76_1441340 [compost metagenome]
MLQGAGVCISELLWSDAAPAFAQLPAKLDPCAQVQPQGLPVGIVRRPLQGGLAVGRMLVARADAGEMLGYAPGAIAPVGLCADSIARAVGQQLENELAVVAVEDPHADPAVLQGQGARQVDDGRQALQSAAAMTIDHQRLAILVDQFHRRPL